MLFYQYSLEDTGRSGRLWRLDHQEAELGIAFVHQAVWYSLWAFDKLVRRNLGLFIANLHNPRSLQHIEKHIDRCDVFLQLLARHELDLNDLDVFGVKKLTYVDSVWCLLDWSVLVANCIYHLSSSHPQSNLLSVPVFPFLTVPTATLHVFVEVVREQYEPELSLDVFSGS